MTKEEKSKINETFCLIIRINKGEIIMGTNPNMTTLYIRDENMEIWLKLNNFHGDFLNWCIKNKGVEYLKSKGLAVSSAIPSRE